MDAFVDRVVRKSVNNIPPGRRTARDGAKYLTESVKATYSIYQQDWTVFADRLAVHLATTDLANDTGVSFVRFYTAVHGLRMTTTAGKQLLEETLDVDHAHVDLLQVHKATSLSSSDDNETLLVDFRQAATLFHDSTALTPKMMLYRVGFLENYGHIWCMKAPTSRLPDEGVTFAQAYNSSTKMARPADSGLLPAAVLCHYFKRQGGSVKMRDIGSETRHYVRNVVSHFEDNVRSFQILRLEVVITVDPLRCAEDAISSFLRARNVFSPNHIDPLSAWLLTNGGICRFPN